MIAVTVAMTRTRIENIHTAATTVGLTFDGERAASAKHAPAQVLARTGLEWKADVQQVGVAVVEDSGVGGQADEGDGVKSFDGVGGEGADEVAEGYDGGED